MQLPSEIWLFLPANKHADIKGVIPQSAFILHTLITSPLWVRPCYAEDLKDRFRIACPSEKGYTSRWTREELYPKLSFSAPYVYCSEQTHNLVHDFYLSHATSIREVGN